MNTKEDFIELHKKLHGSLDVLIACYIESTEKTLEGTNLLQFIHWSYEQMQNPSCFKEETESSLIP